MCILELSMLGSEVDSELWFKIYLRGKGFG